VFACDPRIEAARKPFAGGRSAAVHAALLADTVERLRPLGIDIVLAWRGDEERAAKLQPRAVVAQRGRSFGERMGHAAHDVAALGYARLVFVGADCPTLTGIEIRDALDRLDRTEVVIVPAKDGGINLLATSLMAIERIAFENLPWETEQLHGEMVRALAAAEVESESLAAREDVDRLESLIRFLRAEPGSRLARLLEGVLNPDARSSVMSERSGRAPLVLFGPSFLKSPPDERP